MQPKRNSSLCIKIILIRLNPGRGQQRSVFFFLRVRTAIFRKSGVGVKIISTSIRNKLGKENVAQ